MQYLPQGCQEFQSLASRQTSSLKAKVGSEPGAIHFFFYLNQRGALDVEIDCQRQGCQPPTDERHFLFKHRVAVLIVAMPENFKKKTCELGSDYRSMLAATTTVFICFVVQSSGALALTTACWDERQPEAEGNSSCICKFVVVFPGVREK